MIKNLGILKSHKFIVSVVITVVCVLAVGVTWIVVSNWENIRKADDTAVDLSGKQKVELPKDPALTAYDSSQKSIDGQDWAKAVEDFKTYGNDENNPKPLRITAYANCAWAAQNSGQASEETACLEAGRAVLSQLSDDDIEEAQKAFDAISAGKTYNNTEVAPGDIRE